MSETHWTPEQLQAISSDGSDILVAAAAGSGKTATLVERVIRRLTDATAPMDVDQLLVVTFTDAAAAEMRERIAGALQKAQVANPDDARLQRQLALLGRASISTLHSFCLGLLRQYFYRLGLDPAVQVMNEHEALLLRQEVLDELFARRFEAEPAGDFLGLIDRYGGGRDDEGLKLLVLSVFDYAQSLPWPGQWLQGAAGRFDVPGAATIESQSQWWEPIRRQIGLELEQAAGALHHAVRLAARPGGPAAYGDTLWRELALIQTAGGEDASWADLSAAVQAIVFDKLPAVRKGTADEILQEQVRKLRDQAKKIVKDLQDGYFGRQPSEWLDDLRTVAPHMRTLVELVQEFDSAFRAAKAGEGAVDFTDLERFALQLLLDAEAPAGEFRPSDVARELRGRYSEILVDEYQDINGVQDAILTLVARDGTDGAPNRFMVGDVKQSIYRFRHANPTLFLEKYQSFLGSASEGDGRSEAAATAEVPAGVGLTSGRRIVLGANFRSRSGVVDAVNFLFRQILTPTVGELAYDRDAELVYRASYPDAEDGPAVELHLMERALEEGAESGAEAEAAEAETPAGTIDSEVQALQELDALTREARLVAHRIRSLVDAATPVWDAKAGEYRRMRYRDIVILLRATTGRANKLVEELTLADIPAYAQLSTGYFAATEVETMLALLQLLDNPRQDVPLAAVLHSPIVGLSGADMAKVRLAAAGGGYYDALLAASRPDSADPLLAVTLARFVRSLQAWRTAIRRRPLSEVLWEIYRETGFLSYAAGMPGGAQRHANLLSLYDRARQFDQFARQGLFRFLRFIERLRAGDADLGTAPALGEGEDVVRVMSIHKSKGLEFPVVIIADMGKKLGAQDQQGDLLLQRRVGFGPLLIDPELRVKYPTLASHAAREAIRLEALAEEMRVLYVALTRARERLILVGSCRDLPAQAERWALAAEAAGGPLTDAALASATSYLDWIGPAVYRHAAGAPLWAIAGRPDPLVIPDRSQWAVQVWDLQALKSLLQTPADAAAETVQPDWDRILALQPLERDTESDAPAELARRFGWRYPHAALAQRFAKLTVTELKGHFDPDAPELPAGEHPHRAVGRLERRPKFLQETRKTLSPSELGTLTHLVLQHLDLSGALDPVGIAAQVAAMAERDLIAPAQAEALDLEAMAAFFASPLGASIRQAPEKVRREVSFTLGVPAAEVYPDLDPALAEGETVVVQGMIDLLLQTDDGYVLVDYKTDKRDPQEAAAQYRGQVALYRRAVESILGRPVVRAYLHFLTAGESVEV